MTGALVIPAGAAIGLLVGSFIGAAAMRLPRGESIMFRRSHCDGCGRVLRPAELVPVVSCIWRKGRCGSCGSRIDRYHVLAELGGAAVAGLALAFSDGWTASVITAIFGWQLLLLALLDGRSFWMPMALIGLLGLSSTLLPVLAFLEGGDWASQGLLQMSGGALGFVLLAAPALAYRKLRGREGLGAADPWLLAAIGLWLGPLGVILTVLLAAAAGLAAAAALRLAGRSIDGETALPLGTLMALSGFAVQVTGTIA